MIYYPFLRISSLITRVQIARSCWWSLSRFDAPNTETFHSSVCVFIHPVGDSSAFLYTVTVHQQQPPSHMGNSLCRCCLCSLSDFSEVYRSVFTVVNVCLFFFFAQTTTVIISCPCLLLHPTPFREGGDSHTQIHMWPVHILPVALQCVAPKWIKTKSPVRILNFALSQD